MQNKAIRPSPRRCFRKLFIYHSSEREYRFEGRDYHQSCELCQRIEPTRFLKQLRIYMQYQDSWWTIEYWHFSAEDLIAFSLLINNKEYNGKSLSDFGITKDGVTTYRLLNDIELTDEDCKRMKPIGMDGKTLEYKDIFDGQGFSICNLTLPNTSSGKSGLFGHTSENAMIKNLCIKEQSPMLKESRTPEYW